MRLPDETNRLAIVGATGSGKTQAALWHLSVRDIDRRPWIIYNFKRDKSIDKIPFSQNLELDEIPLKPGIFVVHPTPSQQDEVEKQMWEVWAKTGIGIYVDEGYMIDRNNDAFGTLLTQGRSLECPMIVLSQRPVWMNRFVFSESDFVQVFRLQHKNDRKTVSEFVPVPKDWIETGTLPKYHSLYYDVGDNKLTPLTPVPDIEKIHDNFARRLRHIRKTV